MSDAERLCSLPDASKELGVFVLHLPTKITQILLDAKVYRLSELEAKIKNNELTEICQIGEVRAAEIKDAFCEYCLLNSHSIGRHFFDLSQVIYYLCAFIGSLLILKFTVQQAFDYDELAVLIVGFMVMISFDTARAISHPRVGVLPLSASHLRAIITYFSQVLVLAVLTHDPWDIQESKRAFLLGLLFALLQTTSVLIYMKKVGPSEFSKKSNGTGESKWLELVNWYKSLDTQIRAAIVGGTFVLLAAVVSGVMNGFHILLTHIIFNQN